MLEGEGGSVSKRAYKVLTWDFERQQWTPQAGLPAEVNTKAELSKLIAQLHRLGFDDVSITVERDEPTPLFDAAV